MAFSSRFLTFGAILLHYPWVSECGHEIRTFTYHRNDVTKKETTMVPTNALSKKTLIECAVISSSASKTSFYFRENPMECIVEEEERVYLSGPFKSEFIRFVTVRKGLEQSAYTLNMMSESSLVNPGESYVAYCNISSYGVDHTKRAMPYWSHNGQKINTDICEVRPDKYASKYDCELSYQQGNNVNFEFIVRNVQKADEGNLTCEVYEMIKESDKWVMAELVTMKSVPIQVKDVEMSNTNANEKRQAMMTPVPTRKKSLADELLDKAKGLLKTTNVLP